MKPTEIKNVITEILESRKEEGGIIFCGMWWL